MTVPSPAEVFNEGSRFRALRGAFENPRQILTAIGVLTMKESQRAFREERLGSARWKSRGETGMNPNWPAILRDFALGRSAPPARRFQDRPVLYDTGLLKKSVTFQLVGSDTVVVGSNLHYADALHAGRETKTDPITRQVQDRLEEWIDKTQAKGNRARKRKWKTGTTPKQMASAARAAQMGDVAGRLRWLLSPSLRGQTLTVKHPARPIVGLPKSLIAEIEKEVGVVVRSA